jgi:hypothetical protein
VVDEYLQKWSMTLAMFGRCEQSGYNLATIQPTIQLIIAIKQGLNETNDNTDRGRETNHLGGQTIRDEGHVGIVTIQIIVALALLVRGHPSISLPLLSSTTLPMFYIYSLSLPLYHLQGLHLQSTTSTLMA